MSMARTGDTRDAGDARDVVVGVFRARQEAERALEALRDAGFDREHISLLTQNPDGGPVAGLPESDAAAPPDASAAATTGAVAGGVIGSIAGWLLSAGALFIPGVGPFIAAGALATALAGAAVGAGLGAITGALGTLGIPEEEARWYEEEVRGGGSLLTVKANGRFDDARHILRAHGAYDVETRDPDQVGYGVAGGSSTTRATRAAPSTADSTSDRLDDEARLRSVHTP
jgi:hypothetical protein